MLITNTKSELKLGRDDIEYLEASVHSKTGLDWLIIDAQVGLNSTASDTFSVIVSWELKIQVSHVTEVTVKAQSSAPHLSHLYAFYLEGDIMETLHFLTGVTM